TPTGDAPAQPDMPDLACRAGWALALPDSISTAVPARITSPAPGSDLTAVTQTFNWDAGVGVTSYQLTVGTAPGGNDLFTGPETTAESAVVSGLPSNGDPVWARLSSNIDGTWQSVDSLFTAATVAKATPTIAWLTPATVVFGAPLSGAQLNATASVPGTFVYSPAAGAVLN